MATWGVRWMAQRVVKLKAWKPGSRDESPTALHTASAEDDEKADEESWYLTQIKEEEEEDGEDDEDGEDERDEQVGEENEEQEDE